MPAADAALHFLGRAQELSEQMTDLHAAANLSALIGIGYAILATAPTQQLAKQCPACKGREKALGSPPCVVCGGKGWIDS